MEYNVTDVFCVFVVYIFLMKYAINEKKWKEIN